MKIKLTIENFRIILVIVFFMVIGFLISFRIINKKDVKKEGFIEEEFLIKDKDTQAVIKHFERSFYSDEGKLQGKLVSEYARYSPTSEKKLITLENIIDETVFYDSSGRVYHLKANRGEYDEITNDTFIMGDIEVSSEDGMLFETKTLNYKGKENILFSKDRFRITDENLLLDGIGFKINLETNNFEMSNLIKTKYSSSKKSNLKYEDMEILPSFIEGDEDGQGIYIESSRFKFDYEKGLISYLDDVFINYDQLEGRCDRLDFLLNKESRKLEKAILTGDVFFKSDKDNFNGVCNKVAYDVLTSEAKFEGEPKIWIYDEKKDSENWEIIFAPKDLEIKFEIPLIMKNFPFYPILQKRYSVFFEGLNYKRLLKFESNLKNIMMKIADISLSSVFMTYDKEKFNCKDNVEINYSISNKESSPLINVDKENITENLEYLNIKSQYLDYYLNENNLVLSNDVQVKKDLDFVKSDQMFAYFDDEVQYIEELTFINDVKTDILVSSMDLNSFSGEDKKQEEDEFDNLKITSDELFYSSEENLIEYRNNVKLVLEDEFIYCDRLKILSNAETKELEKILASGNVKTRSEDVAFSGDFAEYIKEKETLHLYGQPKVWVDGNTVTGNDIYYMVANNSYRVEGDVSTIYYLPGKEESKEDTSKGKIFNFGSKNGSILINSDLLKFNREEQIAEYINNVKVENEDIEILAQRLKIFTKDSNSGIDRILAEDNVRIQSGDFVGLGDYALYIEELNKVILYGSSKIFESEKIISSGDEISFIIDKNKVQIDSNENARVKTTLFIDANEENFGFSKEE